MTVGNLTLFFYVIYFMTVGVASAAERSTIGWEELSPPHSVIEDPFAKLTTEQLDALRKILRFEGSKEASSSYITPEEAEKLRDQLSSEGLDVDWFFRQRKLVMQERKAQATAVNPNVIGMKVRMPGYLVPLEFEGLKVISFLLVPYAGACIHTPPPPANQMVHVTYASGIEVPNLSTPVWIEGTMSATFSIQDVGFSDGGSRVEVGYEMSAESVYLY